MRPVGFLFYKCIHYLFGFWSFPFRAACFVFIIANLILQFILYTRVFQKIEFAMLALLAGCFHGALWSIYASTGTIFDVLCLFFLLLALNSYIGYVHRPRSWLLVLTYLLTIWAIQSKEIGYAAPVLLLCYEICLAIPAAGPPFGPRAGKPCCALRQRRFSPE